MQLLNDYSLIETFLQRAYDTALSIAARHTLEVQRVDELRECNFGTWEGLNRAEVIARSLEDARLLREWERDTTLSPPEGESFQAMQERVCVVVERLAQVHPEQAIVLVSHVGPLFAFSLIPPQSASSIGEGMPLL